MIEPENDADSMDIRNVRLFVPAKTYYRLKRLQAQVYLKENREVTIANLCIELLAKAVVHVPDEDPGEKRK